jgi:hypothetical protein
MENDEVKQTQTMDASNLGGGLADKCQMKTGGYADTFCTALERSVEINPTKKEKGLFIAPNAKLGQRVTVHSGDFLGKGIVANYCPFCGGQLRDFNDG